MNVLIAFTLLLTSVILFPVEWNLVPNNYGYRLSDAFIKFYFRVFSNSNQLTENANQDRSQSKNNHRCSQSRAALKKQK